jgi:hypothetical protein
VSQDIGETAFAPWCSVLVKLWSPHSGWPPAQCNEPTRVDDVREIVSYDTIFERLAQDFQDVAFELRQFIQAAQAMVR